MDKIKYTLFWRGSMNNEIVKIGDKVLCKKPIKGIVEKVYKNSVIINIITNETDQDFSNNKTVISHKN
jgi:uncharacterized protein YkvS